MNQHPEERHLPRLDPFVFPSETTLRFVLLIISVVSTSLFIYNFFYWGYRGHQIDFKPLDNLAIACESQSKAAVSPMLSDIGIFRGLKATGDAAKVAQINKDAFSKCIEPYTKEVLNAAWFAIGGVGILMSLASLLYSLFPALMIWKEGLISLENQADMEDIAVYLRGLCQEIGIRPPKFLQKPIDRAIGGRAFGALGRYYVVLPTGLLLLFDRDRDKFRAVMLHELSHLRNQDVDKIYFSVAISFAFALLALLPFAISLWSFPSYLFQMIWRVIALTLLVYLTFTSVVRSRELYADVRASTYAGSEALVSLFQAAPKSKFSGLQSTIISTLERLPYFKRNRWQFVFLFHPDASERRQVLETTDRLFYLDAWAAFTTGIVLFIAYENTSILTKTLADYFSKYNDGTLAPTLAPLMNGFIFAPLTVGILGVGVWRRTFVTLIRHQHSTEVGKLGLALGLGMIFGQNFSLRTAGLSLEHNLAITLFGDVLLLVGCYYLFRWMAVGAFIWLQVAVSAHSPRPFYTAGLIVVGFWLTLLFGVIFAIWDSAYVFADVFANSFETLFIYISLCASSVIIFAVYPFTLIASASLWAFPLSACLWHKRQSDSTVFPRWGFLDQMPDRLHPLPQKRLEVYPALKIGLIGGFIFFGLLLVLRLGIRISVPESVRSSEWFILFILAGGQVCLAALMQAGTAMKVARKAESFRKVQGLFAAFIAGCVMTVSALALNLLFGGKIDAQFVWTVFSLTVNCGAMLSLLAMMMVRLPKNRTNVAPQV